MVQNERVISVPFVILLETSVALFNQLLYRRAQVSLQLDVREPTEATFVRVQAVYKRTPRCPQCESCSPARAAPLPSRSDPSRVRLPGLSLEGLP